MKSGSIGVGMTCRNRNQDTEKSISEWRKYLPENCKFVIVYDCHGLQIYDSEIDGWHLGNEETSLDLESVHQLQNLYFAIKLTELKLKS